MAYYIDIGLVLKKCNKNAYPLFKLIIITLWNCFFINPLSTKKLIFASFFLPFPKLCSHANMFHPSPNLSSCHSRNFPIERWGTFPMYDNNRKDQRDKLAKHVLRRVTLPIIFFIGLWMVSWRSLLFNLCHLQNCPTQSNHQFIQCWTSHKLAHETVDASVGFLACLV